MKNRYETYDPKIYYGDDTTPEQEEQVVEEPVQEPEKEPASKRTRGQKQKRKPKTAQKKAKKREVSLGTSIANWWESGTPRLIVGIFLAALSAYLIIAFLSYTTHCIADQSAIREAALGAAEGIGNAAGEAGARSADFLIDGCFGLGSAVIVFWTIVMALKLLTGYPRYKSVNFTIKCLVALITVSLIIGLATLMVDTPVNWGGVHGRYVNEFIIRFFGWSGAVILCLFMVALFIVICLRDVVNWLIRIHKERMARRAIQLAEKAKEDEKQAMIDELARSEQEDAQKAGESGGEIQSEDVANVDLDSPIAFNAGCYYTAESVPETDPLDDVHTPQDEPDASLAVDDLGEPESEIAPAFPAQTSEAASGYDEDTAPFVGTADSTDATESDESDPMVVNVVQTVESRAKSLPTMVNIPGLIPYRFPSFELLRQGESKISVDETEQLENQELIRRTLLDFGIPIERIEATVGPTITLYEIVPEKGVKIQRIRSLEDDIALRIAARGVRIIAPIPGHGTIGLEVPNKDPQTVSMRTVLRSQKFTESKAELPLALGSSIANGVYVTDLAKMPHLLVAGATGQGKSVGLNAIMASLLYSKTPEEIKFVMIDPKMVEFSLYEKIERHYLAKLPDSEESIVTDMKTVVRTLSSLCVEMDDRYKLLRQAHVKKVTEYNDKFLRHELNPQEGHRYMPYIVVVVDEFSDLIMTAGRDVEMPIARLAQKGRAAGLHIIIATQRPSANVITGIIKANFPARIAFRVSSGIDSKTILDSTGAQQLIGRGDMLILHNSETTRVQCAFIDTPEIEAICEHISQQPYNSGPYLLPEPIEGEETDGGFSKGPAAAAWSAGGGARDQFFPEVARMVVMSGTASASHLQRTYEIGYNRAGRIMDQLEACGVVGPAKGGKPREVLMGSSEVEDLLRTLGY